MADRVGNLAIIISGDSKQFMQAMSGVEATLAAAQQRIDAKQAKASLFGSGMKDFAGKAIAAVSVGALVREMVQVGQSAVEMARDLEQAEFRLRAVADSAAGARHILSEGNSFTSGTMLDAKQFAATVAQMKNIKTSTAEAIQLAKSISTIGIVRNVDPAQVGDIYSKVRDAGKLGERERKQLTAIGFPMEEIAKQAGVPLHDFNKAVDEGRVSFASLDAAFKELTSATGEYTKVLDGMKNSPSGKALARKSDREDIMALKGKQIEGTYASWEHVQGQIEWGFLDFQESLVNYSRFIDNLAEKGPYRSWRDSGGTGGGMATYEREWRERVRAEVAEDARRSAAQAEEADAKFKALGESIMLMADRAESGGREVTKFLAEGARYHDILRNPMMGRFRAEMEDKSFGKAARTVQEMQALIASKHPFRLPTAAAYGSQEAEDTFLNAMESLMAPKADDATGILKRMEEIERNNNRVLDKIETQLRNLKAAKF